MSTDNDDYFSLMLDQAFKEFQQMDQMMKRMFRETGSTSGTGVHGPYYYGYSLTMGPDGRPTVREFGNLRPPADVVDETAVGTREPPIDTVLDSKNNLLRIVAEMPGVTKDDIKVNATEQSVMISAERGEKKYHVEVQLPAEIKPDSTEASYNNGILELTAKLRASARATKGTDVKVN